MLLGLLGFVIFIVSFVATTGITVWFVVKLPADYFVQKGRRRSENRASISDWIRFLLRNLLAVALVGLGIILSLPGIPGQGVLTILLGIMLSTLCFQERQRTLIIRRFVEVEVQSRVVHFTTLHPHTARDKELLQVLGG